MRDIPLSRPGLNLLRAIPVSQWEELGYLDELLKLRIAFDASFRYASSYFQGEDIGATLIGGVDSDNDCYFNDIVIRDDGADVFADDVLKEAYEGLGIENDPSAPDFVGYRRIVLPRYIFGDGPLYKVTAAADWEQVVW